MPENPNDPFEDRDQETFDVIGPGQTYESVTESISRLVLTNRVSPLWILVFAVLVMVTGLLGFTVTWTILFGPGTWGNNIPVAWAFGIINFVWWIGFGHAGTFISAFLLLLHQNWRTAINRFAEAMTLFAVMQAGLFPVLHLGRHQYAYWLFPVPNSMALWPQFRSPLMWDVFAVSTYFLVSLLFWYVGLIPDLATLRDRASNHTVKIIYGVLAFGWRGSALHWRRYNMLYLLLAGLATPLVVSVHTIVSYDFAYSVVPGWHSTIFPPYFVAGALFQGFALCLLLAIPMRATGHLRNIITLRHLENMAKMMLVTGMIVFYGYIIEVFFGWYSADKYESYMTFQNRMLGPYAAAYWLLIFCNGVVPQLLWFRRVRTNIAALFIISMIVSIGMWFERFIIIVTSLVREYDPAYWAMYYPTWVDWGILFGTIGFFSLLFLLFSRVLPVISIAEMRELVRHHGRHASFTEAAIASEPGRRAGE
jgi:molybdopterin-containing oxidoreductase family membrane subunit